MIKIVSQDAFQQYDELGNAITYWDAKKCSWIVNTEYEEEEIDWYGEDSDFPAGCTLAEYESQHPDWKSIPDISVTWTWNTKQRMQASLGRPTSIGEYEWYDKQTFPYSQSKYWGDIECTKEEAIERFGKYCGFNKGADKTVVKYNNEIIFEGNLL